GSFIFDNVISEKDYDWGQGAPGPLLRETDTVYMWQKDSRYLTARLLDLPASVVVIDPNAANNLKSSCPVDATGSTKACISETDYTYDEAAYIRSYENSPEGGSLPQGTHIAAPNSVRGLQTTVGHWLNTTNSFVSSHTYWYDTGEPYQSIDPLGHTTTHIYSPTYAGAYSTQTCNAKSQCVNGAYDFQTGLLTSFTDANGAAGDAAHTTTYGYDQLGRLIDVLSPPDLSGGRPHSHFTPSDGNVFPANIQRQQWITSSMPPDTSINFFDGLGRLNNSQHVTPQGTVNVDMVFDAFAHPMSVSNPYFTKTDATYGLTQPAYDALGRPYQVTDQDGSIKSADFSVGNCTLTKDEAGTQRRTCSDALGRLVEVDEPNPGAGISTATANVIINGNEQANPQPA